MSALLIIILVVLLFAALPNWGYSSAWGYGPSGLMGIILVVLVVLLLTGRI